MGRGADGADGWSVARRGDLLVLGWALVLAAVVLGPALGRGLVLSYDMVWVPDLALSRDALGLGTALPRAVPSDAVVAVLDDLLGGALLQKLVLLATLTAAGAGCGALVRDRSTAARLVAASLAVWNPFVVERLALGHWPLLIGYAVVPWLALAVHAARSGRLPVRVPLLLVLGSLSASAGLSTAVVALAVCVSVDAPGRARRTARLLALLVAANAPWVVTGLVSPADGTTDPLGAQLFSTGDEGLLPGPLAALSLGGVWNLDVVPGSRLGVAGALWTALLVLATVVGAVALVRRSRSEAPDEDGVRTSALVACWVVGWGLATLSWAAPGALGWLAAQVPGAGVLRDGSRLLGLAVPLVVVLVAAAVDELLGRLPDRASALVVGGALAVLPLTLMPDAAWGAGGELRAVDPPASWARAAEVVASASPGDAVSLPFESYRAPSWNGRHPVLDPVPRLLPRTTVANDELVVSGRRIAGEDPRAGAVARALAEPTPQSRSAALRAAGVSVAVVAEVPGVPVPELSGTVLPAGDLTVVDLGPARSPEPARGRTVAVALGWVAWLALLLATPVGAAAGLARRRTSRRAAGA